MALWTDNLPSGRLEKRFCWSRCILGIEESYLNKVA
jgi:hypothetical protein